MFLENLWKQLDKMSASGSKSNIAKTASSYLLEGYKEEEAVELLVDDGYDPVLAKSCVAMVAGDELTNGHKKWGFEVEDQRGDIANNFDLGLEEVIGEDEAQVLEEAQNFVDAERPGLYTVIRIFAL